MKSSTEFSNQYIKQPPVGGAVCGAPGRARTSGILLVREALIPAELLVRLGADGRNRTINLPITRRLLCLLSYVGICGARDGTRTHTPMHRLLRPACLPITAPAHMREAMPPCGRRQRDLTSSSSSLILPRQASIWASTWERASMRSLANLLSWTTPSLRP